jgi:hypothetical protein
MVGFSLLILGTQYAGMIIPNLKMILSVGVPLFLQEIGNLLPILIAIPLAVKFGFGRRAIGACSSISREPSVAVIQEQSSAPAPRSTSACSPSTCAAPSSAPSGSACLAACCPLTGLHPLALAAGSGVADPGSMLSAASGALINGLGEAMAQQVLSIAAASNPALVGLGSALPHLSGSAAR